MKLSPVYVVKEENKTISWETRAVSATLNRPINSETKSAVKSLIKQINEEVEFLGYITNDMEFALVILNDALYQIRNKIAIDQ